MFATGSKEATRSPDNSVSLDLMESPCRCEADAHEKKLGVVDDSGCMSRKWDLMCFTSTYILPGAPEVVTEFVQDVNTVPLD